MCSGASTAMHRAGTWHSARGACSTPAKASERRLAQVGQTPLEVTLSGKGGVPSDGVSGVMLNVTAVAPTADTFITVYPGGGERPLASNLNVSAGQVDPQHGSRPARVRRHGDDVQQQRRRRSRRRRRGVLHRLTCSVAWPSMVDQARRERLLAVKIAALIGDALVDTRSANRRVRPRCRGTRRRCRLGAPRGTAAVAD